MFPLQEGDTLARITEYELYREKTPLLIRIHYKLAGNSAGKYVATIHAPEIQLAHQWAVADSEQAALRETLSKVHDMTYDEIVRSD